MFFFCLMFWISQPGASEQENECPHGTWVFRLPVVYFNRHGGTGIRQAEGGHGSENLIGRLAISLGGVLQPRVPLLARKQCPVRALDRTTRLPGSAYGT